MARYASHVCRSGSGSDSVFSGILFLCSRWYRTGMRRSALKETLLRSLRSQISRHDPPFSPFPSSFTLPDTPFNSFSIHPRLGERWVRLTRSDDREDIKIDATMFDGHAPRTRSGDTTLSNSDSNSNSNVRLHITLSVEVSRKDYSHNTGPAGGGTVMQFLCSAWPDALDVDRVFAAPRPIHAIKPYLGPHFKDLDEEMKKAVHDYLEERGVNDELAAFLHKYVANKDRTEHIRWLKNIESYVKK